MARKISIVLAVVLAICAGSSNLSNAQMRGGVGGGWHGGGFHGGSFHGGFTVASIVASASAVAGGAPAGAVYGARSNGLSAPAGYHFT